MNRSVASIFLEETEDEAGLWIVVYDFIGSKPNPNFWVNLKRISTSEGGNLIQYSVYQTEKRKEAHAVRNLVHHYGGEARIFRCFETNL
ncbi:MAG: hypothetical protein NWE89_10480 [Candidatus Bathyarchaeota archaeon]|nr:hypothetical protein [Candidatus Bathyarchaeota archaeon]